MLKQFKKIREEMLGINRRNISYIHGHNPRKHFQLADNKVLAKRIMEKNGISVPETYAVINSIGGIEEAWKQVSHHHKLVIKPARGRGGSGILLLSKVGNDWLAAGKPISLDEIFSHMANVLFGLFSFSDEDQVIVERCIEPHSFFHKIYSKGVPDIRVIVFNDQAIMSMLRLPTNESGGKANLHQGGLGVGVHTDTGVLKEAYDGKKYLKTHPDTEAVIEGEQLPFWKETIQLALSTAKVFPLNYLGVDIILDEHLGPQVIEINVRPGLGIQMANKQGLRKILTHKKQAT